MAIWRMRIACWIPKATYTHSEYVILIALPLQQLLNESNSMLYYAYISCLVCLMSVLSIFFLYTVIKSAISSPVPYKVHIDPTLCIKIHIHFFCKPVSSLSTIVCLSQTVPTVSLLTPSISVHLFIHNLTILPMCVHVSVCVCMYVIPWLTF